MALPINEVPKYTCKLPSTGQTITYRPFLVKEQKVMLTALESEDDVEIGSAVNSTLQSCIETDLNVLNLPIFDFEYLFLKIRSKSVGEVIKLKLKCPDDDKQIVEHELNLEEVNVTRPEGHTNKIEFEPGYGIIMQYPTIKSFKKFDNLGEMPYEVIKDSIKTIYKGDDVYDRNNIEEAELDDFINSLTQKQFKQLQSFFETMPRIRHTIDYKNPVSGKDFSVTLNGSADFF
tara:strand:+ start:447 stop:1142 length:696 start_codon:yes stop_codon:yes gene_type:complete